MRDEKPVHIGGANYETDCPFLARREDWECKIGVQDGELGELTELGEVGMGRGQKQLLEDLIVYIRAETRE